MLEQTDGASLGLMEPHWKAVKTSRGKQRPGGVCVWFWLHGVSHDRVRQMCTPLGKAAGEGETRRGDAGGEQVSSARRSVTLGRTHRCYNPITHLRPAPGETWENMCFRHCFSASIHFNLYIHPHTLVTDEDTLMKESTEQAGRVIFHSSLIPPIFYLSVSCTL